MDFCTLGMLIIDDIQYPPPRPPSYDVIGGAGTFATLGARLFRPSPGSKQIGWTVHRGYDFPKNLSEQLDSWETGLQWIETPERQTTRALNEYVEGKGDDFRAFRYTTEKIRIDETHLTDDMLLSKTVHMVCSPERCTKLVQGIQSKRAKLGISGLPAFIWEPVPDSCVTGAFQAVKDAARYVDVISPNVSELAALFVADEKPEQELEHMEQRCVALLDGAFGEKGGKLVIRCGSKGCYLRSNAERLMMPAYWPPQEAADKVIDPTGAGNAFLGGLCIGLQVDEPKGLTVLEKGAIYGTVAASFAVEQVGVPRLSKEEPGEEYWNEDSVTKRLEKYVQRIHASRV